MFLFFDYPAFRSNIFRGCLIVCEEGHLILRKSSGELHHLRVIDPLLFVYDPSEAL